MPSKWNGWSGSGVRDATRNGGQRRIARARVAQGRNEAAPGEKGIVSTGGLAFPGIGGIVGNADDIITQGGADCAPFSPSPQQTPGMSNSDNEIAAYLGPATSPEWKDDDFDVLANGL